jgi:hypothetical protein
MIGALRGDAANIADPDGGGYRVSTILFAGT